MLFFINSRYKLSIANLILCLIVHSSMAIGDSVEFSVDALEASDRGNVDLSRFAEKNYVAPARYLLDIKINGRFYKQDKVTYIVSPDDKNKTLACLTPNMVEALALKEKALKLVRKIDDNFLDITTIPSANIANQDGALDITIPQAWMKYSDPDWVPPERWDNGVPGLLLDYSISGQTTRRVKNGSGSTTSFSAYGQTGVNLGAWRLRAQYQGDYSGSEHEHNFEFNQIYAYRPLPMQAAKITLGEIYSNSKVFDTVRFTGINLASDERMLPPNLQGYAPQVRGIAKSNAKVTVSQSGRTIYETTVPAGPFNIQDLNSSVRGELDVKVEEQDGSVTTFKVNTANIPYLTRPGYIRYNTSVGRPSQYDHKIQGPAFYTGDFSWGLNNSWSVYGGVLLSGSHYNAWSTGIGRDLDVLGAVSADVTQSISKLPGENSQTGMSFKLSYAKTFDEYNSTITFAGYRFSQKKYRTQSQYLDDRYSDYENWGRDKEMYTITGNKTFWADDPDKMTTVFLTYTHQNYWDKESQDRYGLSASRTFSIAGMRGITTNLSLFRSSYQGRKDDSLSFSISMPIGDSRWAGYDLQMQGRRNTQMASYSDNTDYNNLWRVRAGADQGGKASVDGYYQHRAAMAQLDTNISYQQDNYISVGGTARGGITATRYGAAIHNSSATQDTARIMVDTGSVTGIPLNNKQTRTNLFGIGVVPDVASYNSFDTRIDVDALGEDVEVSHAIATATFTEGAIGYEKFSMAQGERIMAQLRLHNGESPPFGAEVLNDDGVSVAMIMDGGIAYLSGIKPGEKLSAVWEGKKQCTLHIPEKLTQKQAQILLPCQ
nr:fimbria/pilus outer membrane usher protein [uncultured Erwinia sp.]